MYILGQLGGAWYIHCAYCEERVWCLQHICYTWTQEMSKLKLIDWVIFLRKITCCNSLFFFCGVFFCVSSVPTARTGPAQRRGIFEKAAKNGWKLKGVFLDAFKKWHVANVLKIDCFFANIPKSFQKWPLLGVWGWGMSKIKNDFCECGKHGFQKIWPQMPPKIDRTLCLRGKPWSKMWDSIKIEGISQ